MNDDSGDSENGIHVEECFRGRKFRYKKVVSIPEKRKNRYNNGPQIKCNHGLNDRPSTSKAKGQKQCKAAELCYEDIMQFHHHVTSLNKADQDKYLLKFMTISSPQRRIKTENAKRKKTVSVKYAIRKKNSEVVPVCASTFQGVSGMSKDRLSYLASRFHKEGKLPKEMRGGDTTGKNHKDLTINIKNDIKKYKCRESHYGRGKSKRGYLPSDLTVKNMWKRFCDQRKISGLKLCSLSKYKNVFYKYFNLSFRTPHTDTCSTCKMGLMAIQTEKSLEKKNELRTSHRLHKLRAQQFYKIMKEENSGIIKVYFDMQQNQPIPKLSVSEVFYARQVWIYNLCIMTQSNQQSKENIVFYTWLETESPRGCNQVASALLDFLSNLETKQPNNGPNILHLFSDSCSSQNKNSIMMATLIAFLEKSEKFSKILHFFPVRGHSYMAPDRVFGRLEKLYRRKENILSPKEYYDILEEHGTLKVLNKDWEIKNLKDSAQKVLKPKLPFKMSSQRVLRYTKENNHVNVSVKCTYFGDSVEVEVLRREPCHQTLLSSTVLPKKNMVSKEKKKDVSALLKYFKIPDDAKGFYKDVLED